MGQCCKIQVMVFPEARLDFIMDNQKIRSNNAINKVHAQLEELVMQSENYGTLQYEYESAVAHGSVTAEPFPNLA